MTTTERIIDLIVGPILDRFGSDEVEQTFAGNIVRSVLIDKKTKQRVGSRIAGARDGAFSISTFDRPTTLRLRFQNYLSKKG